MIFLEQGISNTILLTLNERLTISAVSYTMTLTRNNSEEFSINLGTDLSSYPERFNKFTLTSGQCAFGINNKGRYEYTYVVTAYDSGNNSEVVEQGICFIYVHKDTTIFKQHDTNNEFKTKD